MKKILLLMSFALIGFSSCDKSTDETDVTPKDSISSPTKSIEVNNRESGLEITISSSAAWTATTDVSWAKITAPADGNGPVGDSRLSIDFEANTGAERHGKLTLTTTSGVPCVIPLTQTKG